MRIFALNIRHGGGPRDGKLLAAIRRQEADAVVLTEFRSNATGQRLKAGLEESGFLVQVDSEPMRLEGGVLIAARLGTVIPLAVSRRTLSQEHWCRFAEVDLGHFRLGGIYFPPKRQQVDLFWAEHFHGLAAARKTKPYLFIGDFNSACAARHDGPIDYSGKHLTTLLESEGWIDAWRSMNVDAREFTWVSTRGGAYRLDYAFASPRGPRVVAARHVPETRGDTTDHAGLVVDIEDP